MSNEILGLLALAVLFAAIFIGFPIAFTLGAVSLGAGFIAFGPMVFDLAALQTFSVMKDTVLASIPFFLFMGFLLEQSGLMERMFTSIQQLLAGVRGSLYLAVLITATIFAAATGIVGSSVTLLGVMAAPSMIKSGYDVRMSAGAITAGGTLGILIPPSVMLIVMGPVVGVPATDLFAAAVVPGLLLSTIFTLWCLLRCWSWTCLADGTSRTFFRACYSGVADWSSARGGGDSGYPGGHPGRYCNADRCRRCGLCCGVYFDRRFRPYDPGQNPQVSAASPRGVQHDFDAGSLLQPVWRRIFSARKCRIFGQPADQFVAAAHDDVDRDSSPDLHIGLAVGMGADCFDRPSHRVADRSGRRY
jgi:hypothetical protein